MNNMKESNRIIAVISDIHGNFDALDVVLKDLATYSPERIICLGDIIGYGPEPCKCMDALYELNNVDYILGNHEAMWLGLLSSENCSGIGKSSADWNKYNIPEDYRKRIAHYCEDLSMYGITFCHTASIGDKKNFPYLNSLESIVDDFSTVKDRVVIYGHTHRARITEITKNNDIKDRFIVNTTEIKLNSTSKYYINVGSVGQQRDSITDCSYALISLIYDQILVTIKRLEYDSYATYCKIRNIVNSEEIATYLIREKERRERYENSYNRR